MIVNSEKMLFHKNANRYDLFNNIFSLYGDIIMRKKIIFYGQVQGINFRFTAKTLAKKYNLTGWVENNEDESVTLVAEGAEENIEGLINNLKNCFQDNIENIEEKTEKNDGLIGFEIK